MEKLKQWLQKLYDRGFLCYKYKNLIDNVISKEEMFKIACDTNGISYIPELELKNDVKIPFDVFKDVFKKYINGKNKPKYYINGELGYDSSIYMDCEENKNEINIDTTISCLLGYKGNVTFPKNSYCTLYIDKYCDVNIYVENSIRLRIFKYGNPNINISGDQTKVKIINNG